jgi:ABC-type amino acid transport substrate-binding protein
MKKILFFLLLLVISPFLFFYFYKKKSEKQPKDDHSCLLVGISADFPPFAFIEDSNFVGFDVDLTMLIAKELKQDIAFKNMPFVSLLPALQLKQIHMVVASVTPTNERRKRVLFSDPYIDADPFVIVSKTRNRNETLTDLCGRVVIVNSGYSAEKYVESLAMQYSFSIQRMKNVSEAIIALKNDIGDAFITAESTVAQLIQTEFRHLFSFNRIPGISEQAAIVFHKDQQEFCEKVNEILKKLKEDGTIDFLKKKWNVDQC